MLYCGLPSGTWLDCNFAAGMETLVGFVLVATLGKAAQNRNMGIEISKEKEKWQRLRCNRCHQCCLLYQHFFSAGKHNTVNSRQCGVTAMHTYTFLINFHAEFSITWYTIFFCQKQGDRVRLIFVVTENSFDLFDLWGKSASFRARRPVDLDAWFNTREED